MAKDDTSGLERAMAAAPPVLDVAKPRLYSIPYRAILANNKSLVFCPARNDNYPIGEPRQGVNGSMFKEFLVAIKDREGSNLSEEEIETRAQLLADVYDVLPYGKAAIERDLKLIREKRAAASETFGKPLGPPRVSRRTRSIELDVETLDLERMREARRLLRAFERHPERFGDDDIEAIRAARRLVQGHKRRQSAHKFATPV